MLLSLLTSLSLSHVLVREVHTKLLSPCTSAKYIAVDLLIHESYLYYCIASQWLTSMNLVKSMFMVALSDPEVTPC